ncbi:MAG: hypothetical protein JWN56_1854 [Sphingobacteriales bacterium]|nr:hypothetical protein [Sphingobacteriales bacterium]
MKAATNNVDEYITGFPKETQLLLEKLRATIKNAAPEAEEMISYQMPAYKFHGMLVYFGGYKNHIGFYPTGSGIEIFKEEIKDLKYSKGTIQFPLDKPLPLDLVTKIVVFRVMQNLEKSAKRAKK